ncbi:heavy metal-binding domain-containing protein [bacterium]|nr:heavy metal-binding domain-containing protein [bacterium]
MFVSGMSGNEIFCLALKSYTPGELTVGNCVNSMGISGGLSSFGRQFAGGEIQAITNQISEGRHAAITRMENEAKKHGAVGVTGVTAELKSLAGYTEFLAQGTAIHSERQQPFFSTAASGIELYCHLDAGYRPIKFAMGNIAYALGVTRGFTGSLRTFSQGEVKEYSQMYNEIRHTALNRLRAEAAQVGANSVVDADVRIMPYGGATEFLVTGTASNHPKLGQAVSAEAVVTSELSGEELWNLAKLGYAPKQLVMATSIYSLGLTAGIGAMFKAMRKGEIPEVTQLVYSARENCLDLIRKEAKSIGAVQVIGNKLTIIEMAPGLLEIFAVGTAIVLAPDMKPESPALIPQAVITDKDSFEVAGAPFAAAGAEQAGGNPMARPAQQLPGICGCLFVILFILMFAGIAVGIAVSENAKKNGETNTKKK